LSDEDGDTALLREPPPSAAGDNDLSRTTPARATDVTAARGVTRVRPPGVRPPLPPLYVVSGGGVRARLSSTAP
jgi:hypothetical protein